MCTLVYLHTNISMFTKMYLISIFTKMYIFTFYSIFISAIRLVGSYPWYPYPFTPNLNSYPFTPLLLTPNPDTPTLLPLILTPTPPLVTPTPLHFAFFRSVIPLAGSGTSWSRPTTSYLWYVYTSCIYEYTCVCTVSVHVYMYMYIMYVYV
jgi:hypothetical protein